MKLHSIETGNFKLDGGAMFGVVPKVLWEKTNPADSQNRIEMSARCLLIEDGEKLILIDTGLGNKQSEKFFSHYARSGDMTLKALWLPVVLVLKILPTCFSHTSILIIVVVQLKERVIKLFLFLKTQSFGALKTIGSGQVLAQIPGKKLPF